MAPNNLMKVVKVVQKVVKPKAVAKGKGKKVTWKQPPSSGASEDVPPGQQDIPSIENPEEFKAWKGGSFKKKQEEFQRQLGPQTIEEATAMDLKKWFP